MSQDVKSMASNGQFPISCDASHSGTRRLCICATQKLPDRKSAEVENFYSCLQSAGHVPETNFRPQAQRSKQLRLRCANMLQ